MSKKGKGGRHEKKKTQGRSRGDWLFGIGFFVVVVLVAVASVWWGLAPAGQQRVEQQQTTVRLYSLPPGDPTLTTCVGQSDIVKRLKVNLRIVINGSEIRVPARIGMGADCVRPLHTRDSSGTIYVESPVDYPYTLKDFFAVWNQAFSRSRLFFLRADANHRILMTVNGQPNEEFENHVLNDGEQIVITYT